MKPNSSTPTKLGWTSSTTAFVSPTPGHPHPQSRPTPPQRSNPMRKQSHSPDRAVIPSGFHPSPPFSFDFQLSTVNLFPTGRLEPCVIISGIAPPFSLDFQLSTVNFFLTSL